MAVVQISRIQIRRGTEAQGESLPQLASGEMAWAIDTQNLYIGNGAVSEGAPAVGNTRLLTEADAKDIFSLADTYVYQGNDSVVQTGPTAATPIRRSLQGRLDDFVNAVSFGVTADGVTDDTAALQRAIDQLFINAATKANPNSRVTLQLPAGTINVTDTIYIPPYASIVGAGAKKTIISTTSVNPVFQTVNGDSVVGTYAADATTTSVNQPKNIVVKGMTIEGASKALSLNSTKDSLFEDLEIVGVWDPTQDPISTDTIAIEMSSLTTAVTCENNIFSNLVVRYFSYGIDSNYDIKNNSIDSSVFELSGYGVSFGRTTNGLAGQGTGPSSNRITNNRFDNVKRNGVWIENGSFNIINNNVYFSVGNDGGTITDVAYPAVQLTDENNIISLENFERTQLLSASNSYSTVPYIPEVQGKVVYDFAPVRKNIDQSNQPAKFIRLPVAGSCSFEVRYMYKSTAVNAQRFGSMFITVDLDTDAVQISDEYDYVGDSGYADNLEFTVFLSNESGTGDNDTINIYAQNTTLGDTGYVEYKPTQLS